MTGVRKGSFRESLALALYTPPSTPTATLYRLALERIDLRAEVEYLLSVVNKGGKE